MENATFDVSSVYETVRDALCAAELCMWEIDDVDYEHVFDVISTLEFAGYSRIAADLSKAAYLNRLYVSIRYCSRVYIIRCMADKEGVITCEVFDHDKETFKIRNLLLVFQIGKNGTTFQSPVLHRVVPMTPKDFFAALK